MKKFSAMLFLFCSSLSFADTITLVADEWCPYNCDPKAANPGYMIEIAKLAFEAKGHTIDYKLINWERALQMVKEGKAVGAVGADKSELEGGVYPAEEMGAAINSFFALSASNWSYAGPDSMKGQKIGVIQGYPYDESIEKFFKANAGVADFVSGDNATETNIKKLQAGRINAYLENEAVFNNKAKDMGLDSAFKKVGSESDKTQIYIVFSPSNAQSKTYSAILSDKVKELRANGELSKILAKYGLKDWK